MDLSPNGSFGYVPERDQDTVAMLDTNTLKIARRAEFPEGSKPWMLRVSPDGREVWVQTASGSNVVLDARTLETLHTEELGEQPVQIAWSPDGRYNFVTHFADSWVAVMDPESGKLVKRLEVGQNGANVSFRPDGRVRLRRGDRRERRGCDRDGIPRCGEPARRWRRTYGFDRPVSTSLNVRTSHDSPLRVYGSHRNV